MIYKETKSLFLKKYQYKIVLVTSTAPWFRGGDVEQTLENIEEFAANPTGKLGISWSARIKLPNELTDAKALALDLKKMSDYDVRVESPFVSVYTNNVKNVSLLEKKFEGMIKYISKPAKVDALTEDTVVMPKLLQYDFKITMAASKTDHLAFVNWATNNPKIRITKSCIRDLSRNRSWGGTHFYVTGEKNLLVAKMHLGGCIAKIQRIVKE